ncbi:TPA: hypothetical protein DCW38_05730 [candidate division WOR-3 bacterium]|jgi:hypothetical protein|uniref:Uncharacterized protein n=1 Tax=candidate division WOR-3 bacterium TaxID=2052148 RepID=A0A350HAU6_UNCW3|nr:hypothetical protein [candidate division WOR-3 bacterium]
MKFIGIVALTLLLASCSMGPVYVYTYQPVVKIEADTTEQPFYVHDLEPDGWWAGDGVDTILFPVLLKETKDISAYITDIEWNIVTELNGNVNGGNIVLLSPLELKKSSSDTIEIPLVIEERDAYEIDISDGIQDNVGNGVIIIKVVYYDERANKFESLPFYLPIKVIKP